MARHHVQFLPTLSPPSKISLPCYSLPLRQNQILTFPLTHQHLSYCTFSNSLTRHQANLTEPYNQDIKVQVTAEDVKQEYTLCMKSAPPETESAKCAFQIQPPFSGVNFSNNATFPKTIVSMSETEYDTTFETS